MDADVFEIEKYRPPVDELAAKSKVISKVYTLWNQKEKGSKKEQGLKMQTAVFRMAVVTVPSMLNSPLEPKQQM